MSTGWNASDSGGGFVVSGTGNSTVTTTTQGAIRSNTSHASGKWYFELTLTGPVDPDFVFGIASSTIPLTGLNPGLATPSDSVGMAPYNVQEIYQNGTFATGNYPGHAATPPVTISVCVDTDNLAIWFIDPDYITLYGANGWNGSATANPSSNIGGIVYTLTTAAFIAIGVNGTVGGSVATLNTGGSSFLRAPPSGFSAWDNFGTAQQAQAFLFGAGGYSAGPTQRMAARATLAGAGGMVGRPFSRLVGKATFAGSGGFFYNFASANLQAATSVVSTDFATASLAGNTAAFQTDPTVVSTDSAVGYLSLPSPLAATTQLQNALVDTLLRGQLFQPPSVWYVALVTQLGDPSAPGLEVSGSGYSRASLAASLVNWSGTQGAGSTLPSSGVTGTVSNNAAISFGAPTSDWGTIIGYELWDATTGGNRWLAGKLAAPLTISNGGPARSFSSGNLSISIG